MDRAHIRAVQSKLAEMGLYKGKIDGLRGNKTHAAVNKGMGKLGPAVPSGFAGWSGKRKTIAFLQAYAESLGIEAGDVDGLWGPQTNFAADALLEVLDTGAVRNFQDEVPSGANPDGFPDEARDQKAIKSFYGKPGVKGGFTPPLERVPLPWKMKISFLPRSHRTSLQVHKKAAPSLKRVLARIDAAYTPAQRKELGIDVFGGDYSPRKMRGADRHSLHSWGIAFDFDPDRNQLRWNRHQARLGQRDAIPFWEAWEAEGWCSLGRLRNFDFMHVQAAHRAY